MKKRTSRDVLLAVLAQAEKMDYAGFSKFDALNSPALNPLAFNNKWLRLIYTQLIKASPFNLRSLLKVAPSRNPKGIALFARAYLILYRHTGYPAYKTQAEALLDWLITARSPGEPRFCWGYNFVWQSPLFLQSRFEPNIVVTVFAGEALIEAFEQTGRQEYLDAALSAGQFIMTDMPVIFEAPGEMAIAYVKRRVKAIVLNNQVLAGAFLIKLWRHTQEAAFKTWAVRLIDFTVNRATPYHAWYYTHPKGKSPIVHDNYHTGGILDGLLEYQEMTSEDRYREIYRQGLEYYRRNLFTKEGAPKWMNNKVYPHDIHGAAQGIITFAKAARYDAGYWAPCHKIIDWTLAHLYSPIQKTFLYRKGRLLTWNYTLMRWCNAWMARALAEVETTQTFFMEQR